LLPNNAHYFLKKTKKTPPSRQRSGCSWLPFERPYSFASQAFACFAVFLLHLLPLVLKTPSFSSHNTDYAFCFIYGKFSTVFLKKSKHLLYFFLSIALKKALFKKVLHNFTKFSTQKKPVKKLFLPASFACLFVQEILFSVLPNQRNFITVIRIPKNFLLLYKENPSYKEQNA